MASTSSKPNTIKLMHLALVKCDFRSLTRLSSLYSLDLQKLMAMSSCIIKNAQQNQPITPLQAAVISGNYMICKALIIEGAEFFSPTSKVMPPLILALELGHYQIARLLVTSGAPVSLPVNGIFPMHFAITPTSPVFIVEHILDAGFPVDSIIDNTFGFKALHRAICMENYDVISVLVKRKANCNSRECTKGQTPLHLAGQIKLSKVIKLLVENGADLEAECNAGLTSLFYAINREDTLSVSLLLELGADVHHLSSVKQIYPLRLAIFLRSREIVELLLKYGADLTKLDVPFGDTALHCVAAAKPLHTCIHIDEKTKRAIDSQKIVEKLIQHGFAINTPNPNGYTPMQIAIKHKNFELVEYFLEEGAEVNSPLEQGTNFHFVANFANKQLVTQFLMYGADYSALDKNGISPYHVAFSNLDHTVLKSFWRFGCPFNCLQTNHIDNHQYSNDVIKIMEIQYNFMLAVKANDTWEMEKSLQLGAEVRGCSLENLHPLQYAVSSGFKDVVFLLLKKGVPVNLYNHEGETPLHVAAKQGETEICYRLLEHGACYNARTKSSKKTPLDLAVENKHQDIVVILKEIDSKFKSKDKNFGANTLVLNSLDKLQLQNPHNSYLVMMNTVDRKGRTLLEVLLKKSLELAFVMLRFRLLSN